MNAKDALRSSMDISLMVLNSYVSDLDDADLMTRPGTGCNHLAWQLGHLVSAEVDLLNSICPGKGADLPEGFAEKHSKETCQVDDPAQFMTKQEYLDLYETARAATLKALEEISDAELDAPSPEKFRQYFPNVGQIFTLIGNHPMMHAGQFAVARRILGKPILM